MIAVDVVLLPPDEIMDRAIEANKNFLSEIYLKEGLPHITLAMGAIEEKDVESIGKLLQNIGKRFLPLEVEVNKIQTVEGSVCLSIKPESNIQELHESVILKLKKYLTYNIQKSMFFDPPKVSDGAIEYVSNFLEKYSFENFYPHITLGKGQLEKGISIKFKASRLAVCWLGSSCTCRKILFEFKV